MLAETMELIKSKNDSSQFIQPFWARMKHYFYCRKLFIYGGTPVRTKSDTSAASSVGNLSVGGCQSSSDMQFKKGCALSQDAIIIPAKKPDLLLSRHAKAMGLEIALRPKSGQIFCNVSARSNASKTSLEESTVKGSKATSPTADVDEMNVNKHLLLMASPSERNTVKLSRGLRDERKMSSNFFTSVSKLVEPKCCLGSKELIRTRSFREKRKNRRRSPCQSLSDLGWLNYDENKNHQTKDMGICDRARRYVENQRCRAKEPGKRKEYRGPPKMKKHLFNIRSSFMAPGSPVDKILINGPTARQHKDNRADQSLSQPVTKKPVSTVLVKKALLKCLESKQTNDFCYQLKHRFERSASSSPKADIVYKRDVYSTSVNRQKQLCPFTPKAYKKSTKNLKNGMEQPTKSKYQDYHDDILAKEKCKRHTVDNSSSLTCLYNRVCKDVPKLRHGDHEAVKRCTNVTPQNTKSTDNTKLSKNILKAEEKDLKQIEVENRKTPSAKNELTRNEAKKNNDCGATLLNTKTVFGPNGPYPPAQEALLKKPLSFALQTANRRQTFTEKNAMTASRFPDSCVRNRNKISDQEALLPKGKQTPDRSVDTKNTASTKNEYLRNPFDNMDEKKPDAGEVSNEPCNIKSLISLGSLTNAKSTEKQKIDDIASQMSSPPWYLKFSSNDEVEAKQLKKDMRDDKVYNERMRKDKTQVSHSHGLGHKVGKGFKDTYGSVMYVFEKSQSTVPSCVLSNVMSTETSSLQQTESSVSLSALRARSVSVLNVESLSLSTAQKEYPGNKNNFQKVKKTWSLLSYEANSNSSQSGTNSTSKLQNKISMRVSFSSTEPRSITISPNRISAHSMTLSSSGADCSAVQQTHRSSLYQAFTSLSQSNPATVHTTTMASPTVKSIKYNISPKPYPNELHSSVRTRRFGSPQENPTLQLQEIKDAVNNRSRNDEIRMHLDPKCFSPQKQITASATGVDLDAHLAALHKNKIVRPTAQRAMETLSVHSKDSSIDINLQDSVKKMQGKKISSSCETESAGKGKKQSHYPHGTFAQFQSYHSPAFSPKTAQVAQKDITDIRSSSDFKSTSDTSESVSELSRLYLLRGKPAERNVKSNVSLQSNLIDAMKRRFKRQDNNVYTTGSDTSISNRTLRGSFVSRYLPEGLAINPVPNELDIKREKEKISCRCAAIHSILTDLKHHILLDRISEYKYGTAGPYLSESLAATEAGRFREPFTQISPNLLLSGHGVLEHSAFTSQEESVPFAANVHKVSSLRSESRKQIKEVTNLPDSIQLIASIIKRNAISPLEVLKALGFQDEQIKVPYDGAIKSKTEPSFIENYCRQLIMNWKKGQTQLLDGRGQTSVVPQLNAFGSVLHSTRSSEKPSPGRESSPSKNFLKATRSPENNFFSVMTRSKFDLSPPKGQSSEAKRKMSSVSASSSQECGKSTNKKAFSAHYATGHGKPSRPCNDDYVTNKPISQAKEKEINELGETFKKMTTRELLEYALCHGNVDVVNRLIVREVYDRASRKQTESIGRSQLRQGAMQLFFLLTNRSINSKSPSLENLLCQEPKAPNDRSSTSRAKIPVEQVIISRDSPFLDNFCKDRKGLPGDQYSIMKAEFNERVKENQRIINQWSFSSFGKYSVDEKSKKEVTVNIFSASALKRASPGGKTEASQDSGFISRQRQEKSQSVKKNAVLKDAGSLSGFSETFSTENSVVNTSVDADAGDRSMDGLTLSDSTEISFSQSLEVNHRGSIKSRNDHSSRADFRKPGHPADIRQGPRKECNETVKRKKVPGLSKDISSERKLQATKNATKPRIIVKSGKTLQVIDNKSSKRINKINLGGKCYRNSANERKENQVNPDVNDTAECLVAPNEIHFREVPQTVCDAEKITSSSVFVKVIRENKSLDQYTVTSKGEVNAESGPSTHQMDSTHVSNEIATVQVTDEMTYQIKRRDGFKPSPVVGHVSTDSNPIPSTSGNSLNLSFNTDKNFIPIAMTFSLANTPVSVGHGKETDGKEKECKERDCRVDNGNGRDGNEGDGKKEISYDIKSEESELLKDTLPSTSLASTDGLDIIHIPLERPSIQETGLPITHLSDIIVSCPAVTDDNLTHPLQESKECGVVSALELPIAGASILNHAANFNIGVDKHQPTFLFEDDDKISECIKLSCSPLHKKSSALLLETSAEFLKCQVTDEFGREPCRNKPFCTNCLQTSLQLQNEPATAFSQAGFGCEPLTSEEGIEGLTYAKIELALSATDKDYSNKDESCQKGEIESRLRIAANEETLVSSKVVFQSNTHDDVTSINIDAEHQITEKESLQKSGYVSMDADNVEEGSGVEKLIYLDSISKELTSTKDTLDTYITRPIQASFDLQIGFETHELFKDNEMTLMKMIKMSAVQDNDNVRKDSDHSTTLYETSNEQVTCLYNEPDNKDGVETSHDLNTSLEISLVDTENIIKKEKERAVHCTNVYCTSDINTIDTSTHDNSMKPKTCDTLELTKESKETSKYSDLQGTVFRLQPKVSVEPTLLPVCDPDNLNQVISDEAKKNVDVGEDGEVLKDINHEASIESPKFSCKINDVDQSAADNIANQLPSLDYKPILSMNGSKTFSNEVPNKLCDETLTQSEVDSTHLQKNIRNIDDDNLVVIESVEQSGQPSEVSRGQYSDKTAPQCHACPSSEIVQKFSDNQVKEPESSQSRTAKGGLDKIDNVIIQYDTGDRLNSISADILDSILTETGHKYSTHLQYESKICVYDEISHFNFLPIDTQINSLNKLVISPNAFTKPDKKPSPNNITSLGETVKYHTNNPESIGSSPPMDKMKVDSEKCNWTSSDSCFRDENVSDTGLLSSALLTQQVPDDPNIGLKGDTDLNSKSFVPIETFQKTGQQSQQEMLESARISIDKLPSITCTDGVPGRGKWKGQIKMVVDRVRNDKVNYNHPQQPSFLGNSQAPDFSHLCHPSDLTRSQLQAYATKPRPKQQSPHHKMSKSPIAHQEETTYGTWKGEAYDQRNSAQSHDSHFHNLHRDHMSHSVETWYNSFCANESTHLNSFDLENSEMRCDCLENEISENKYDYQDQVCFPAFGQSRNVHYVNPIVQAYRLKQKTPNAVPGWDHRSRHLVNIVQPNNMRGYFFSASNNTRGLSYGEHNSDTLIAKYAMNEGRHVSRAEIDPPCPDQTNIDGTFGPQGPVVDHTDIARSIHDPLTDHHSLIIDLDKDKSPLLDMYDSKRQEESSGHLDEGYQIYQAHPVIMPTTHINDNGGLSPGNNQTLNVGTVHTTKSRVGEANLTHKNRYPVVSCQKQTNHKMFANRVEVNNGRTAMQSMERHFANNHVSLERDLHKVKVPNTDYCQQKNREEIRFSVDAPAPYHSFAVPFRHNAQGAIGSKSKSTRALFYTPGARGTYFGQSMIPASQGTISPTANSDAAKSSDLTNQINMLDNVSSHLNAVGFPKVCVNQMSNRDQISDLTKHQILQTNLTAEKNNAFGQRSRKNSSDVGDIHANQLPPDNQAKKQNIAPLPNIQLSPKTCHNEQVYMGGRVKMLQDKQLILHPIHPVGSEAHFPGPVQGAKAQNDILGGDLIYQSDLPRTSKERHLLGGATFIQSTQPKLIAFNASSSPFNYQLSLAYRSSNSPFNVAPLHGQINDQLTGNQLNFSKPALQSNPEVNLIALKPEKHNLIKETSPTRKEAVTKGISNPSTPSQRSPTQTVQCLHGKEEAVLNYVQQVFQSNWTPNPESLSPMLLDVLPTDLRLSERQDGVPSGAANLNIASEIMTLPDIAQLSAVSPIVKPESGFKTETTDTTTEKFTTVKSRVNSLVERLNYVEKKVERQDESRNDISAKRSSTTKDSINDLLALPDAKLSNRRLANQENLDRNQLVLNNPGADNVDSFKSPTSKQSYALKWPETCTRITGETSGEDVTRFERDDSKNVSCERDSKKSKELKSPNKITDLMKIFSGNECPRNLTSDDNDRCFPAESSSTDEDVTSMPAISFDSHREGNNSKCAVFKTSPPKKISVLRQTQYLDALGADKDISSSTAKGENKSPSETSESNAIRSSIYTPGGTRVDGSGSQPPYTGSRLIQDQSSSCSMLDTQPSSLSDNYPVLSDPFPLLNKSFSAPYASLPKKKSPEIKSSNVYINYENNPWKVKYLYSKLQSELTQTLSVKKNTIIEEPDQEIEILSHLSSLPERSQHYFGGEQKRTSSFEDIRKLFEKCSGRFKQARQLVLLETSTDCSPARNIDSKTPYSQVDDTSEGSFLSTQSRQSLCGAALPANSLGDTHSKSSRSGQMEVSESASDMTIKSNIATKGGEALGVDEPIDAMEVSEADMVLDKKSWASPTCSEPPGSLSESFHSCKSIMNG